MVSIESQGATGRPYLRRRDFLAFGSAGLVSLCMGDRAWAQVAAGAGGFLPLPVAYLAGSAEIRDLKRLPATVRHPAMAREKAFGTNPLGLVSAARIPLGDTNLIGRPLRLRIHGLYPPAALAPKRLRELPLAIDLDVLFPAPDPAFPQPARYQAWSFRREHGWNASPPVSFVFPLDWYVYPALEMRVVPAGSKEAVTMATRFTLDDESGLPRLQRGLYLLGFQPGEWTAEGALAKMGGTASPELFSILVSIEPEGAAE
jgi:hypothetical protein